MSDEFAALLDEIAGHSEWDWGLLPPEGEGDPDFSCGVETWVAGDYPTFSTPRWEPTEKQRGKLRELRRCGIEAQREHTTQYSLVPAEVIEFGWLMYDRYERRLVALDRNGRECGTAYYKPRPVDDTGKRVPPEETEGTPAQEGARTGAGAKKLGYGDAGPVVLAAIKTYEKSLSRMRTRKDRARFLAGKVGCSPSTVDKILKRGGW